MSQYLRELDSISPQDSAEETFNMEADLALFTNTQFFDFESGQTTDFQAQPVNVKPETEATTSPADVSAAASVIGDMPNLDFISSKSLLLLQNPISLPLVSCFMPMVTCGTENAMCCKTCIVACSAKRLHTCKGTLSIRKQAAQTPINPRFQILCVSLWSVNYRYQSVSHVPFACS